MPAVACPAPVSTMAATERARIKLATRILDLWVCSPSILASGGGLDHFLPHGLFGEVRRQGTGILSQWPSSLGIQQKCFLLSVGSALRRRGTSVCLPPKGVLYAPQVCEDVVPRIRRGRHTGARAGRDSARHGDGRS